VTKNQLVDAVVTAEGPQALKDVALACAEGLPYGLREKVEDLVIKHEFYNELQVALTHEVSVTTRDYVAYVERVNAKIQKEGS